jgi:predicted nucleotidyltransferase
VLHVLEVTRAHSASASNCAAPPEPGLGLRAKSRAASGADSAQSAIMNAWSPPSRSTLTRFRARASASGCGDFDPATSDVDFLVEFLPDRPDRLDDYLGLKEALAQIVGRDVDLVVADAVRNPYFRASAFGRAQDVYAA